MAKKVQVAGHVRVTKKTEKSALVTSVKPYTRRKPNK